ncbi:MAG TPA: hypothetical protein VEX36_00345 [Thermoleophilaceae bacterium]|nr:hypothetical protein [Thermoleophilaceae bacterium]
MRVLIEKVSPSLRGPFGWPQAIPLVVALLAAVAVTNRWMSWTAGFFHVHANDERAYLTIARAFPGVPDERIADQHAQRWTVHWAVGGLADLFGTSPETVYRCAAIGLAIAVVVVLAAVLIRTGVSFAAAALALGAFVLSPYVFRYYMLAPGYLADLVFELGLVVVLLGMVRRSLPLVLVGLIVGVLGRQTMVVVAPVVGLWIALAPEWRGADRRRAVLPALAALVLPVAVYMVVKGVAADFSRPGFPFSRLTILDTVLALPGTAADLLSHVSHVGIALLVIGALLLATLLSVSPRELPSLFWGSLAIAAAIVAQVLALNPDPIANDFSSTNQPRLTAIALPALAVAFAVARRTLEQSSAAVRHNTAQLAIVGLPLLLVATLNHSYTVLSTGAAAATLMLQAIVAAMLFAALLVSDGRVTLARPRPD